MGADTRATLSWSGGEDGFEAVTPAASFAVGSGAARRAPSPMELLLTGVAGCMAVDVVEILGRMRKPPAAYRVEAEGWRAPNPPRRFTRVRLTHRVVGADAAAVRRAVELSRTKYCSAMATLDPGLDVENEVVVEAARD